VPSCLRPRAAICGLVPRSQQRMTAALVVTSLVPHVGALMAETCPKDCLPLAFAIRVAALLSGTPGHRSGGPAPTVGVFETLCCRAGGRGACAGSVTPWPAGPATWCDGSRFAHLEPSDPALMVLTGGTS
jgi:hypothetical protein